MGARGPMLVQIHRCNQFLTPAIKDVLVAYLWGDEPDKIMEGEVLWLSEYRASTGEELAKALVEVDPSMVVEVDNDDGEYAGVVIHHPDLGWFDSPAVDGEPFIGRSELNKVFAEQPDDLMGWLDARLGNAWFRAIAAIPQDDSNRLTKGTA